MVRTVIVEGSKNMYGMDVFSRLSQDRILFIDDDITDELANGIISQLLYLDAIDNKKEITILINSYGGSVYDGLGIIDVMKNIKSPIKTIVVGKAMSMAAEILLCGDKRSAYPNATIMLHCASGGSWGKIEEVKVHTKEFDRLNSKMMELIQEHTKVDIETLKYVEQYYTPKEALALGIIDEIR